MARPREFDEAEVLDRALALFWRVGYEAAPLSELVTATGLQRQSLYNAFGDKRGLFLAALARYRTYALVALEPLTLPNAGLVELREYMHGVIERQRAGNFGACLMVKTAFGPERGDPEIRELVEETSGRVRACFAELVARLAANGGVRRDLDPAATAAYLYTVLNGLSALGCTGDEAQIDAVIAQSLATLTSPTSKPPRTNKPKSRA